MDDCEFCRELTHRGDSDFERAFKGSFDSRIVLDWGPFVAMPSLGQLSAGSLMLLSRAHVERFADFSQVDLDLTVQALEHLRLRMQQPMVAFEHGAKCRSGGGCGIYHAHIHLVPLPARGHRVVSELALGLEISAASRLTHDWIDLRATEEYLLLDDGQTRWRLAIEPSNRYRFPSQFFRRRLAAALGRGDWDWRGYAQPEPAVGAAIRTWSSLLAETSRSVGA